MYREDQDEEENRREGKNRKKTDTRRLRCIRSGERERNRERETAKRREEISVNFSFGSAWSERSYPRRETRRGMVCSTDRSIGIDSRTLESRNS